jgi:hypothetical protein
VVGSLHIASVREVRVNEDIHPSIHPLYGSILSQPASGEPTLSEEAFDDTAPPMETLTDAYFV